MVPCGFLNETTLSCIVNRNATLQTIGGNLNSMPNQTLPALLFDVSQYLPYVAGAGKRSVHGVGCLFAIHRSSFQLFSACFVVMFNWMTLFL